MSLPCGTHAAYVRHMAYREPVDDACREAERAYRRKTYERAKADPERMARLRAQGRARARATTRLLKRHPQEYEKLYSEEMALERRKARKAES